MLLARAPGGRGWCLSWYEQEWFLNLYCHYNMQAELFALLGHEHLAGAGGAW